MEGLKEIIIAVVAMVGTIIGKEYWDYKKNKDTVEGTNANKVNQELNQRIDELETKLANCEDTCDRERQIKQDRIDHLERANYQMLYDIKTIMNFLNIVKDEEEREKLLALFSQNYQSDLTSSRT